MALQDSCLRQVKDLGIKGGGFLVKVVQGGVFTQRAQRSLIPV